MGNHRALKTAAILVTLGYCSLLVYQSGVYLNAVESRTDAVQMSVSKYTNEALTNIKKSNKHSKNITLDDIFISVKTTKHYQYNRLPIILKTWFQLAKEQTWFFTDTNNRRHQVLTNGHMVDTHCPTSHARHDLCCKTSVEFDFYLESDKKWFCHFDDDNYVNVPRLVSLLQQYNYKKEWYLGRAAVSKPVNISEKTYRSKLINNTVKKAAFWFGTGGAGYCISRSLALRMLPVAGGGKFMSLCEKVQLPDDVTLGYIIEHLFKTKMTSTPEFHSHLEDMKHINPDTLRDQVSLGYARKKETTGNLTWNVIDIPGFDVKYDPTRFLSLHCHLFPHVKFCPR